MFLLNREIKARAEGVSGVRGQPEIPADGDRGKVFRWLAPSSWIIDVLEYEKHRFINISLC